MCLLFSFISTLFFFVKLRFSVDRWAQVGGVGARCSPSCLSFERPTLSPKQTRALEATGARVRDGAGISRLASPKDEEPQGRERSGPEPAGGVGSGRDRDENGVRGDGNRGDRKIGFTTLETRCDGRSLIREHAQGHAQGHG